MPRKRRHSDDPFDTQPRTVEELQRRIDEWTRENPIPTDPKELRKHVQAKLAKLRARGVLPLSHCPHCGKRLH